MTIRRFALTIVVAFSLSALLGSTTGCGGDSDSPAPTPAETPTPKPPPTPEQEPEPEPPMDPPETDGTAAPDAEAGQADYALYCASCHGARGEGDGPIAQTLDPKPSKHSDGKVMNALTDDYLVKVIGEGGQAVGKSSMMAPWGGTLSDEQIRNVVAFIRSLAVPPYQP